MTLTEQADQLLGYIRQRKRAYQLALKSPAGAEVLEDLARFCRASETCFNKDARLHAVLEGRREVWLRIQQHLNLTDVQLAAIFSGNRIQLLQGKAEEDA